MTHASALLMFDSPLMAYPWLPIRNVSDGELDTDILSHVDVLPVSFVDIVEQLSQAPWDVSQPAEFSYSWVRLVRLTSLKKLTLWSNSFSVGSHEG